MCRECGEPFRDGQFFEHEGFPYCETHYHGLRGSLCAGCHKPIQGRCITAMFRKFHPECFVCRYKETDMMLDVLKNILCSVSV